MQETTSTQTTGRAAAGCLLFFGSYVVLTAWIFVGREFVPDSVFAVAKNGGYVAVMLMGVWVFRGSFMRSWRTTKQRPFLALGMVAAGLALMGVASAVSYAAVFLAGSSAAGANQAAISAEVLAASTSLVAALLFVGLGGVVAPFVEELVFREVPFGRLRNLLSTRTALILSSVAFAAVHVRDWEEWPLMILYVGYALAFAAAYLLSDRNLLVCIFAHVLWNGTGLAFLLVTAA